MEQKNVTDTQTLDTYIKGVKDQEIKGILLKLKNEVRKPDADKDTLDTILSTLKEKNSTIAQEVIDLIRE